MPYCSSCGVELSSTAAFCQSCGTPVNRASLSTSTPVTPPPPLPTVEPPFTFHAGAFFGGLLVMIGFLSPWITLKKFGLELDGPNGLQIAINCIRSIRDIDQGRLFFIILTICLAVLIFSAIGCFLYGFVKGSLSDSDFSSGKNAGIIALVVMILAVGYAVNKIGDDFGVTIESEDWDVIREALGPGFWLCFLGTLILGFSSARKKG